MHITHTCKHVYHACKHTYHACKYISHMHVSMHSKHTYSIMHIKHISYMLTRILTYHIQEDSTCFQKHLCTCMCFSTQTLMTFAFATGAKLYRFCFFSRSRADRKTTHSTFSAQHNECFTSNAVCTAHTFTTPDHILSTINLLSN